MRDNVTLSEKCIELANHVVDDPETIDWEDPPEVDVWAGDRLLAFEMLDSKGWTVEIHCEPSQEGEKVG